MDYVTFKDSTDKIDETSKAYQRALAKEEKIKSALNEAKSETKVAKEAYANALEEAKKVVSG